MNSRTSRPRSPISAITLTSHCAPRASMPINVLLPTPAAAKMPMRWPSPSVIRPSMIFTPVGIGRSTMARVIGSGGSAITGRSSTPTIGPLPSIGSPRPLMTRPSSAGPTLIDSAVPVPHTRVSPLTPVMAPNGDRMALLRLKPTTSARCSRRWRASRNSHSSPTLASRPLARIKVPTTSKTLPVRATAGSYCSSSSSAFAKR